MTKPRRQYTIHFNVNGNPNTSYISAETKGDALLLARKRWPHGSGFFIAGVSA